MLRGKFLIAFAAAVLFLGACSGNDTQTPETPIETPTEAPVETPAVEDAKEEEGFTGTAKLERLYDATGKKSDVVVTEVTFENGQPVDVTVDVIMNGDSKRALVEAGNYVMKEGEEFNWSQQMDMVQDFIIANNFDVNTVNISTEAGNTDSVTGVSIKVASYLTGIQELIENVQAGNVEQTGFTGVKSAEVLYDAEKTDMVVVDVVFDNGQPVNVKVDVRSEDGTMKRELVEAGEYVMKEGEEFNWSQQMDMVQEFIVANNFDLTKVTISDDAGHTDAVTGVSIKVAAYLPAIEEALAQIK
ncbi:MAG: hypothetical protein ACRCST_16920 [Turicibacter sp.]